MKDRYEKAESEKIISSEEANGEIITKERSKITVEAYSDAYKNPPIPEGYKYCKGKWNNGFVIERYADKSQFVWVPVGSLDSDGTLNGKDFIEKFGRRNFCNDKFSRFEYNERMDSKLKAQVESVRKYGGYYISRYNISTGLGGKPRSVKNAIPSVKFSFDEAKLIASSMEQQKNIKSHLCYGAEYDSVIAWIIKSNAKPYYEVIKNSTYWGNYFNNKETPRKIVRTGMLEQCCVNNIYDLAGNVGEWTQERVGSTFRVVRGGSYGSNGSKIPVVYRYYVDPANSYYDLGFRVVLCLY